eukprot:UN1899
MASQEGYHAIVGQLLKARATVDARSDQRVTPLIIASYKNHAGVVRFALLVPIRPIGASLDLEELLSRARQLSLALRAATLPCAVQPCSHASLWPCSHAAPRVAPPSH